MKCSSRRRGNSGPVSSSPTRLRLSAFLLAIPVLISVPLPAQSSAAQAQGTYPAVETATPPVPAPASPSLPEAPSPAAASIAGLIVDATGAGIPAAIVTLVPELADVLIPGTLVPATAQPSRLQRTAADGSFLFPQAPAGSFRLSATAPGFSSATLSGTVASGQIFTAPSITLEVALASTEVEVRLSRVEIAQEQVADEEKQRVLGAIPNFYVSYVPDAVPLSPKQKFNLAGKLMLDPVSFGITGLIAGIQQDNNSYPGYGQGAAGYGKRYAAASGTFFDAVLIGNAILPSLLKQDPRYFYKGTGTVKSRVLYALANSVICKGDNGRWQANYSAILGGLAAGGISNLYYPAKDRDGLGLTFSNAAIGTAGSAAGNIFQEFLVRRLTPHSNKPSKP